MKIVKEIERDKWSEFVEKHPNGNVFQTPEMYDVYKNTEKYEPVFLAIKDDEGEILGVLLAVIQREYSGIFGKLSARTIIFGGPIIKNNSIEILNLMLKEYNKIVKKKVIYSQFRNFWDLSDVCNIFEKNGYKYISWLNYVIDLTIGKDDLFSNLSSSKKRQIRKSFKNGAIVTEYLNMKDFSEFHKMILDFYKNSVKKPLPPLDFFRSIDKFLGENDLSKYFIVKHNNKIIGGILCLITPNKSIYEFYVFGLKGIKSIYPSVLATWAPIAWGAEHDMKFFDFMGAGNPDQHYGVREFKSKFGGKLVNYGRFEKVHNNLKYCLARLGFFLWKNIKT